MTKKKLKKKLSTYYMSPVIFTKEHPQNNVSEQKATLKLTHAIKTNNFE